MSSSRGESKWLVPVVDNPNGQFQAQGVQNYSCICMPTMLFKPGQCCWGVGVLRCCGVAVLGCWGVRVSGSDERTSTWPPACSIGRHPPCFLLLEPTQTRPQSHQHTTRHLSVRCNDTRAGYGTCRSRGISWTFHDSAIQLSTLFNFSRE
jgi:hypothetical protein